MRVRLKGINTITKRSKSGEIRRYYYHRATGKRINGDPGTAEFAANFAAAGARTGSSERDFSWVSEQYRNSEKFGELGDATKGEYGRMLRLVEVEFGTMPITALDDIGVLQDLLGYQDRVAKSSGKREADNRLSVISAMLTWARSRSFITSNHLKGFYRLHSADRSEIIWLPEHVMAFLERAAIELQYALLIALNTALREADILRLNWSQYVDGFLMLRLGKTRRKGKPGRLVRIPCTAALRRMLDTIPRTSDLIIVTQSGKPFQKRYFCKKIREVMDAAGITSIRLEGHDTPVKLDFNDLRGTAITMLSEAGCTPQEIATITGHSLAYVQAILDRYFARTRGLAERAIAKLEASPGAAFARKLEPKKTA